MPDITFVLIVIAALLVIVGFCQPLAAYLQLPPPVLLGLTGVSLGGLPLPMSAFGWSGHAKVFADAFVAMPCFSSPRAPSRCAARASGPVGSGEFFGEMAPLSGRPRVADVVALTYCRLLVLRQVDFERFMATNPDARATINRIAKMCSSLNRDQTKADAAPGAIPL